MQKLVNLFFIFLLLAGAGGATTIDTSPATTSVGTFGSTGFGTELYGAASNVPANQTLLLSVQYSLNAPTTLSYTANVCAFDGTACTGASLWTSVTLFGTGTGNLDPVTVNPNLAVTPNQLILFYLFASGGQGAGQLGVNANGDDTVGNTFFFQNGTNPQDVWTGGFLDGSPVAAVLTFSAPGGGGGCTANCGGDPGGGQETPEPATFFVVAVGVLVLILRRI